MTSRRHTVHSRRQFLRGAAAAVLSAPFVTSRSWAASPNGKVQVASFGAGGQAASDLESFVRHEKFQLVAVADVDRRALDALKAKYATEFPDLRVYGDWRELLAKEGDKIDAAHVATPDHMHAPIGLAAMKLGKHVYGQKPLTQNLLENRRMIERAREKGVKTQMGIQVSSDFTERFAVEIVHSGVIGKVKEVHTFSEKDWGDLNPVPDRKDTVPEWLNWDHWLGVAAERPFIDGYYHPGNWRRRRDFGTGTLGDMGCHIFSSWYRALGLTTPTAVKSTGTAPVNATNWAINGQVEYTFPATKYTAGDSVKVTWYDGNKRPPAAVMALIEADPGARKIKVPGQGNIIIGTEGVLLHPHGGRPELFPQEKFKGFKYPKLEPRDHYHEWVDAIIAGGAVRPSANFDYSGPLTESVLLGCLASVFPGEELKWDSSALQFTNSEAATKLVKRTYRPGWEIA
jgi:predicted dehydrogenase